jgi:hypothetical protein
MGEDDLPPQLPHTLAEFRAVRFARCGTLLQFLQPRRQRRARPAALDEIERLAGKCQRLVEFVDCHQRLVGRGIGLGCRPRLGQHHQRREQQGGEDDVK